MRKWDDLSMREKAEMMRVAVSNGITTLPEIKQAYNEFAEGGAMPEAQPAENDGWSMEGNLFGGGGYKPSERIKQRIAHYEGKAMTGATDPLSGKWAKNNSFESEAKNFYNALPRDIREQVLSNPELADSLYSYSYNVGAGRFKERVVPALRNYYNGKGTVQDIENSMWASGDSKLRGLQRRRAEERKGVRNALIGDVPYLPSDTPSYPTIYDMPQYIPAQPQAFSAPLTSYQPVALPDEQQPIVREATAYDPKEIERQERQRGLNNFMTLMSMASPQQDNGMLGAINMLSGLGTANAYGEGGDIYIRPENRGKFTALKERTGHSATWFKEHGTPAQKKMAVFALNARHWKHADGGNLFNSEETTTQQMDRPNIFRYDDGVANSGLVGILQGKDDAVNIYGDGGKEKKSLKERVLGLGLWAADKIGLAKEYKGTDADTHYRRNLYNGVDPGAGYPKNVGEAMMYKRIADNARKPNVNFQKVRETNDPTADAAWAKRLGIPYNEAYLPSNRDGSVRLPRSVEAEIPVDTTFLKDRIAANQKLREKYRKSGGLSKARREAIDTGLRADMNTLDSLRTTFKTGKPVSINEMSFINRNWIDNGNAHLTPSPLSLLQNYTVRYNKDTGRMEYSDIYDFNEFENFVPGKPFNIKGSIKVGKQQKKKQ